MARYHKKVYFPKEHEKSLKDITSFFNGEAYTFSSHCLENLKHRAIDMEGVLEFINSSILVYEQVFEYYVDGLGNLEKICYRLPYREGTDIILVLNRLKKIVTIYINSADDKHETLRKEIYCRP